MPGNGPLEDLAALSRAGAEIPAPNQPTLVLTPAGTMVVKESAGEVMALREQALKARQELYEKQSPEEADMVWVTLEGPNGLPLHLDPTAIVAVQAGRREPTT